MESSKFNKIEKTKVKIKDKLHPIEIIDKERSVKDILFILDNDTPDVLLIMERGVIIGIITDSDIIMKVKKDDLYSDSIKIKDIISTPVISIESDKSIEEAIDKMVVNSIQKLLVIENGMPIGVLYGEDILEFDEEKWKELLFDQTVDEVYKISLKQPELDQISVSNMISQMDKFTNMESKLEFELFVYQIGIVLIAYNYIKENKNKSLRQIKTEIKENYCALLHKYSEEQE